MSFEDDIRAELAALEAAQLRRVRRVVDGRQGTRIVVDGVEVTSFASNDYLGLAGDRRIADAAAGALAEHGVGSGASRLIVGNHRAHAELERTLAEWMRRDGVTLFNTGYAANVGVLTTLLRVGDVVFSDELNHASIIDGCRLARAQVHVFPHRDIAALEQALRQHSGGRRVVVSESVFSMDGDVADVVALGELCRKHDAVLVLDEAHALGVLGPEGRGVAAYHNVVPDVLVGTFGKALGTFGAFATSSAAVAELFWNRARPLVFSTGLPPAVSVATRMAIEIACGREGDDRRHRLGESIRRLENESERAGLRSAIVPVIFGDELQTLSIAEHMFEAKLLVAAVRPPTVPRGTSRLRISLSANHSKDEVGQLREMLHRVRAGL